jgi:hypothetical protein
VVVLPDIEPSGGKEYGSPDEAGLEFIAEV